MSTSAPTISQKPAQHVLFHFGHDGGIQPGGFTQQLIVTICAADPERQDLLALGFPEYVAAVHAIKYDPHGTANLQKIAAAIACPYCGDEDGPFWDPQETGEEYVCEACVSAALLHDGAA